MSAVLDGSEGPRHMPLFKLRNRRTGILVVLLVLAFLYLSKFSNISQQTTVDHEESNEEAESKLAKNSMLHLIVPATSAKPNLCRTLLSAAVLGYPLPILVNWEVAENPDNEYASHLAKITGILKYLRGLPQRNDADLALIVDGYDVWFQLRPEVLIERYFALNKERAAVVSKLYGPETISRDSIKQSVIFGADKKCWPQSPEHPACYSVPESTLPKYAFGKLTDKDPDFNAVRPRWLNSGTILGPVSELRAIFEAAAERVQTAFNGERDQWYFAELFGEQEYHRNNYEATNPGRLISPKFERRDDLVMFESNERQTKTSPEDRPKELVEEAQAEPDGEKATEPLGEESKVVPKIVPAKENSQQVEFHIGLDYEAQLFHTMTHAASDVDWLIFNSSESLSQVLQRHNITLKPHTTATALLPRDIAKSEPPLSRRLLTEFKGEASLDTPTDMLEELPTNTTWGDIPLMINLPSNSVPVLIHINGNKAFIDNWWPNNWWVREQWGRHVLRAGARAPRGPIATTIDEDGTVRNWRKGGYNSLRRENGGMWTDDGHWLPWQLVCSDFDDILFDGVEAGTPPDPRIKIGEARLRMERLRLEEDARVKAEEQKGEENGIPASDEAEQQDHAVPDNAAEDEADRPAGNP